MRSRGMVVMFALALAVCATVAMSLYVRGVKKASAGGQETTSVIVSTKNVPAQSNLDELLAQGAFITKEVPEDAVVDGAVTDLAQLEGKKTASPLLEGEQVSTGRLQGSAAAPGGALAIPEGHSALDVAVPAPALIAGDLEAGDHVTVYASFDDAGKAKIKAAGTQSSTTATVAGGEGVTVVLVPEAEVLKVFGQSLSDSSQGGGTKPSTVEMAVTLALEPEDAQKVVFAQSQGTLYLTLLPPSEAGKKQNPMSFLQVIK